MSELLGHLAHWGVDVVYSFGYGGIFVLIALINLHLLPMPTQIILSLAGFLIGQERFSFAVVLASSTAGAVVASFVMYYLGLWIGEDNLRRGIKRCERFRLVYRSDLDKASKIFARHGGKAIILGHLVPGIGAFISIPAGIQRMPLLKRFTPYSIIGSGLWNAIFIVLGWVLGAQWAIVKEYTSMVEYLVIIVAAGLVLWFLWHRWWKTHS